MIFTLRNDINSSCDQASHQKVSEREITSES